MRFGSLPAGKRIMRLRTHRVHDLLMGAGRRGQLDDIAVGIAEIDRTDETVIDRAAYLASLILALFQHCLEHVVIDAERDVKVERFLPLEFERLTRHFEKG